MGDSVSSVDPVIVRISNSNVFVIVGAALKTAGEKALHSHGEEADVQVLVRSQNNFMIEVALRAEADKDETDEIILFVLQAIWVGLVHDEEAQSSDVPDWVVMELDELVARMSGLVVKDGDNLRISGVTGTLSHNGEPVGQVSGSHVVSLTQAQPIDEGDHALAMGIHTGWSPGRI